MGPRAQAEEFTSFVHCSRKAGKMDAHDGRSIDLLVGRR